MMSRLVNFRRLIIYGVCVFVVKGSVMLNVTSSTSKCPGYKINISCVVDPQTTAVQIVMPNGSYALHCTAPINKTETNCPPIGQYESVVSKVGTTTTFVLTIPSLIKSIHNGIWRCKHGDENNTAVLSVIPPLSSKGRVPTITTNSLGGVIVTHVNISGHVYCQNSEITTEILYASQGEQYTVLESEETQWLHSDEEHNGCDPGESNQTYTFPIIWTMSSLRGKKVSFKIRFKQYLCGENFTTNSSGTFIFTGPPMDKTAILNHNSSLLLVPEATSVTLQCVVRGGIPLAVIAWNCLGGNVTNTSVDGIARSNITFLTSKIQNGSFCTCVATHPVAALHNVSVQILITYAANITGMVISGDNFTVPEHSRPTITCDAEGSPLPLITLRHVKNNTVIAQTTGLCLKYTLPYARCEDTGQYRCEAVNMVKQSHVMEDVFVLCYPRAVDITNADKHVFYSYGETLRISSTYLAYPRPEFNWYFQRTKLSNKSKLPNGSENTEIINEFHHKSEVFRHTSYIVRKFLKEEDFGVYIITAQNYINSSTQNYNVVLQAESPEQSGLVGIALGAGLGSTVFIIIVVLTVIFLLRRRKRSPAKDPSRENVRGTDSYTYAEVKKPRGQKTDVANKSTEFHIVENQEFPKRSNKPINPSAIYALVDKTKQTKKANSNTGGMASDEKISTDAGEKESPSQTIRTKNKDGLIYVDVDIQEREKSEIIPTIHGEDNRTEYIQVDFTKRGDSLPPNDDN